MSKLLADGGCAGRSCNRAQQHVERLALKVCRFVFAADAVRYVCGLRITCRHYSIFVVLSDVLRTLSGDCFRDDCIRCDLAQRHSRCSLGYDVQAHNIVMTIWPGSIQLRVSETLPACVGTPFIYNEAGRQSQRHGRYHQQSVSLTSVTLRRQPECTHTMRVYRSPSENGQPATQPLQTRPERMHTSYGITTSFLS
jgi:hypothetical protein